MVATRTGPGQRTMTAPILRQPRVRMVRLGSSVLPNLLATEMTAGPNVRAASTATTMPMDSGIPSDTKYGSLVKCRQNVAPAMVRPEPSATCAVPWNMV